MNWTSMETLFHFTELIDDENKIFTKILYNILISWE